jgi:hypothetical protein
MTSSPNQNDAATFGVMFTRAVIAWNNAEDSIRYILEGLSKGSLGATIAIRQLGNASLKDAVLVVAIFLDSVDNEKSKEQADHLRHLVEGFDILRVYRNFYVHNLRAFGRGPEPDSEFTGTLHTIEVKARYSWVQQDLTIPELREFTQHLAELSQYAGEIKAAISRTNALTSLLSAKAKPLSSLQKPTWPEKLKKNHENLLAPRPQPQS